MEVWDFRNTLVLYKSSERSHWTFLLRFNSGKYSSYFSSHCTVPYVLFWYMTSFSTLGKVSTNKKTCGLSVIFQKVGGGLTNFTFPYEKVWKILGRGVSDYICDKFQIMLFSYILVFFYHFPTGKISIMNDHLWFMSIWN